MRDIDLLAAQRGVGPNPREEPLAELRRGFDDSGFARTILLVEPTEPFLGTVRLDALDYRNVDLARFYPFGNPEF